MSTLKGIEYFKSQIYDRMNVTRVVFSYGIYYTRRRHVTTRVKSSIYMYILTVILPVHYRILDFPRDQGVFQGFSLSPYCRCH